MSRIRSKDTKPELALRRGLYAAGIRGWRCHPKHVAGRPDVAFTRRQVAIFVDGRFWHGHPDFFTPGKSGDYWDAKIARTQERDRIATQALTAAGWVVLRFWDFEVEDDLSRVIAEVAAALELRPLPADPSDVVGTFIYARWSTPAHATKERSRNHGVTLVGETPEDSTDLRRRTVAYGDRRHEPSAHKRALVGNGQAQGGGYQRIFLLMAEYHDPLLPQMPPEPSIACAFWRVVLLRDRQQRGAIHQPPLDESEEHVDPRLAARSPSRGGIEDS